MAILARISIGLIFALFIVGSVATPLDDYVNAPDPTYNWKLVNQFRGQDFTAYNIYLTSQTWRSTKEVSIAVWTHWFQICVPDNLVANPKTALIYVAGGSNKDEGGLGNPPTSMNDKALAICQNSAHMTAFLGQVPNQPTVFLADPSHLRRYEDSLIAYTWHEFLRNTSEPNVLARLPMTKAVVKAMDTFQYFSSSVVKKPVSRFVIAGESKRGWTTWTTAAVDKRVIGFVPIVMPMGNMTPLINAMYRVYGEWSFPLADYVNNDVLGYLGTKPWKMMEDIIDPMTYYSRWHGIPKYVIAGNGDEFFLPDSVRYFWDQLPEPKLLRMVPNADHHLVDQESLAGINTFLQRLVHGMAQPRFDFVLTYSNTTATITATANALDLPTKVFLYQATTTSTTQRDFRMMRCDDPVPRCENHVPWTATELPVATGQTTWSVSIHRPHQGWTGFMLEAVFPGRFDSSSQFESTAALDKWIRVTSNVNVVPDIFPFAPCETTHSCQPAIPWNGNN